MKQYLVPVVLITIGVAWLLNTYGFLPDVQWLWTLGLLISGIALMAGLGLDKLTFTVGSFLIICSAFSVLRQTGKITLNRELPILVILYGVLMIAAEALSLRPPPHFKDAGQKVD